MTDYIDRDTAIKTAIEMGDCKDFWRTYALVSVHRKIEISIDKLKQM